MKEITREDLVKEINKNLAEEFEVDVTLINGDSPIMETLSLDSLDLVDVVVMIERDYGFTLTINDFVGVKTFDDLYNLIETKLKSGAVNNES